MSTLHDPLLPRLLSRATYGFDLHTLHEADELGWDAWLERQLAPEAIDDSAIESELARSPLLTKTPQEILNGFIGPLKTLRAATLMRALRSRRQLFERTVEFWRDHFNIDAEKGECRVLALPADRETVRPRAFGRFAELVTAVARSGAMLESLDNRSNHKEAPNENFGRELLELHTLGVGNYTEHDVREVARCFTGWSLAARGEARWGEYVFRPEQHDDGAKTVLGRSIPAGGGENDGKLVIAMVALHPATATRLARKLCRFFVAETPPQDLIDRAAKRFVETEGDVRAVLRTILQRASFAALTPSSLTLYRRPFHVATAMLLATRASVVDTRDLLDELASMGHEPFGWPTPDGYPDAREPWESGLLRRWIFVEKLFTGRIAGVSLDLQRLIAGATGEPADPGERIDRILTGGRLSGQDRRALSARAAAGDTDLPTLFTLAACSPSFQEI
jgi:uncharacterized protein (DUF1800 family)